MITNYVSDYRTTQFVSHINAWYDIKSKTQVLNTSIFIKIEVLYITTNELL